MIGEKETPSRKTLLIAGTVATVVIILALIFSGILPVSAQGAIIVTLKDEETGKPIGRVNGGYVRVVLGGTDRGYLTDYGELRMEGVTPGSNELIVVVPSYGEVRRFVDVGAGQTVPVEIEINMPNPVFQVGVEVSLTGASWWENLLGDAETGNIRVSLTNIGNADSVSTSVLVIVYRKDDMSIPIATKMLDFPSLVPRSRGGESVTKDWSCVEFVYGPGEIVATVIFDGWAFTPKNEEVVSQVATSTSMLWELTSSIKSYLSDHPDIVVNTIVKILIAWL